MTYPPKGKTAIVTGGSSGIGAATAIHLAQRGWNVLITGRRQEKLQEVVAKIDEAGKRKGAGAFSTGDVADEKAVIEAFQKAKDLFGSVELVFLNAGIGAAPVSIADLSLQDWQKVVDTNLTGTFLCAREAFRHMSNQKNKGGRIIINGSISATTPRPNSAPYTTTKTALTGLTKSLSLDGRALDIVVSQIDIGNVSSDLTSRMSSGVPQAGGTIKSEPTFNVEHAANQIVAMAELPLEVNVQFATIMASKMPSFIGRG